MICSRCRREIPEDETSYLVRISITADFDGKLKDPGEQEFEDIIKEAEQLTEAQLEAQVHAERGYSLCKPCRDAFVKNPLGRPDIDVKAAPSGMVH